MPRFCAVLGCSNRSDRDENKNFFFFPRCVDRRGRTISGNATKRQLWIEALHRSDFGEKHLKSAYICSDHFVTGNPSSDPNHEDYVPSLKMGYGTHKRHVKPSRGGTRKHERIELKPELPCANQLDVEKEPGQIVLDEFQNGHQAVPMNPFEQIHVYPKVETFDLLNRSVFENGTQTLHEEVIDEPVSSRNQETNQDEVKESQNEEIERLYHPSLHRLNTKMDFWTVELQMLQIRLMKKEYLTRMRLLRERHSLEIHCIQQEHMKRMKLMDEKQEFELKLLKQKMFLN